MAGFGAWWRRISFYRPEGAVDVGHAYEPDGTRREFGFCGGTDHGCAGYEHGGGGWRRRDGGGEFVGGGGEGGGEVTAKKRKTRKILTEDNEMSAVKTVNEFVLKSTGGSAVKSAGIQEAIASSRGQPSASASGTVEKNSESEGGAEMSADAVSPTKVESPVITPKDVTIQDGMGNISDAAAEVASMPNEQPSSGLPTGGPGVADAPMSPNSGPDALATQVGVDSASPVATELREPTAISPEIGGRLTAEDAGSLA